MPRTGGVYSPPAGTKGVPNTTILSNAYNSFVDDLTADANAARPITAGGTGSTSASAARTALGLAIGTNVQAYDAGLQSISALTTLANQMLYTTASDAYATTALTPFARTILDDADAAAMRATMGADNATNLILGTISDARLPTTMAAKSFTTQAYIDGATNAHLWFRKAGVNRGIVFTDDANDRFIFRKYDTAGVADGELALWGAGATELKHNGNTVWTAANDGAGSTLDADLLDGQQGAYYLSAPNLTGTISDARLPTTMAGKTFSSAVTISAGLAATASAYFIIQPTDYGVGKPALYFNRDTATTYRISTYDGAGNAGTINIATGSFLFNGNTVWSSGNDGAGSGLDADVLDGQQGAFYQNATNINAGTLADARLPSTMAGKTFSSAVSITGNVTGTGNADFARFYGTNADTAAAPSFTNAADLNTGMWFPAADQVGISAGGTNRVTVTTSGMTVAGTATATLFSGSGASLTALNGSNISTGTVADARLPTTMGGKTFTGTLSFTTGDVIASTATTGATYIYGGTVGSGNGARLLLFGSTHATNAGQAYIDANSMNFRNMAGTGVPTLTANGNTIWHAGNDGSGSGLDADLLDGLHASAFMRAPSTSSNEAETNFPLGHPILFSGYHTRNQIVSIYIDPSYDYVYNYTGGTQLAGTWRTRGGFSTPAISLAQRVA